MGIYRGQRLQSVLLQELSMILTREMDFSPALVTVTNVEVTEDEVEGVAYVAVVPESEEKAVMDKLQKGAGYIQRFLVEKMQMRRVPKMRYKLDIGAKNAARVEKAVKRVEDDLKEEL
ncbi:MAG: 30S ribosome-binding factor RbfA [Candidatus Harrisonbacteria bacterium]|nr:30S ribosome-binding factor RbfA [Candidatus Harrisonbacteria bacterium]